MIDSESMQNNSTLSQGKSEVQEEIIANFSDDFSQVHFEPKVLFYVLNGKRKVIEEDPWNHSNFALRQMQSASRRGPRFQFLPGSYYSSGNARPKTALPSSQVTHERLTSAMPLATRSISASHRGRSRRSRRDYNNDDVRSETSILADELVSQALPTAALEVSLHNLANQIADSALNKAIRDLSPHP